MGDAEVARQGAHVARAEDVAHQALALVHVKGVALGRGDACCILAAVLEHHQSVIKKLVDRRMRCNPENSAHKNSYLKRIRLDTSGGNQC